MINLEKKGFRILLNEKSIGFVFAKDELDAYIQVGDAIDKGLIETDGTSEVTIVPWEKENPYDN